MILLVSNRKQAYSPYLLISQLPSTIMPDDIKRMAITEGSIMDVIYHRNQYMEFQNKITVVFRSATDAVEFITQKYGKYLGGHKINMNMVGFFFYRSLVRSQICFSTSECSNDADPVKLDYLQCIVGSISSQG